MSSYLSGFMSHAHLDNALCDAYHRALTQRGVACYYDRANPQTGHSLSVALQTEIERAQALIVMVSPAMLNSFWVEQEIDMFLALMAEERTRKLIPIKIAACEMPTRLRARWWLDATREPLDAIMDQLTRALEIAPASSHATSGAHASGFSRVVDWRRGQGDHTTIVEAIAAAQPGERILVRKGVYEGGLTIDKPLELIGDGQPGDVEIHASGTHAIMFTASQGRVANLTLRQTGGGDWYGVDITAGRLELEDCDISSQGHCGIGIHGGANPILHRNRIHDSKYAGVFVYEQGLGLLEDNDIFANAYAGVEISEGGAPTLRRNRIHDSKGEGVKVRNQGQGLLEDNDIFANAYSGVHIKSGGAPTLRHNRIHDNKENGVHVYEQGRGLLEDNDIFANVYSGVEIKSGGAPTLRRNRIHKNGYLAIRVNEQGGGVFEENDLRDNTRGPWDIAEDSKANVTRRGNVE